MRKLFRTKYPVCLCYLILLFNPATDCFDVIRRVCRNSLTPIQVLFLFGCFFGLYLFGGVAYNHVASCPGIGPLYLCGSYPMAIAVCTMAPGYEGEEIAGRLEAFLRVRGKNRKSP